MKTKCLTLFLVLAACTRVTFAWDYEHVKIGDLYYNLDASDQTAQVTYEKSWSSNNYLGLTTANIPSSVEYDGSTFYVTSIGGGAFRYCSSLSLVTLGNSIASIGGGIFSSCSSLTSVTIPNSVTSIGALAFEACSSLRTVTIGNNVTSIGEGIFYDCSSLTSIVWNAKRCEDFNDNNTPFYLYNNGDYDIKNFNTAKQIISFTFGDEVEHIPGGLCRGMCNLESLTIPNNVTSIGNSAFEGCSSLPSVTIPNGVTSIGDWAFSGCSSLLSVTIPNSVTSIRSEAFNGCSGLKRVNISDLAAWCKINFSGSESNPLCYAKHLFLNDIEIKDLVIPNSITNIQDYAFRGCCSLTSITIPNNISSIGCNAFSNCCGVTSITIPESVTSIGSFAFYNVPNIIYSGTATGSPWGARSKNGFVEGWLVYKDESKTQLLACSSAATGGIVIPNSVTNIESNAFRDCSSVTSVTIPNSITSIGDYAFYGCSSLTSVTIPNSVTSIGRCAFDGCSSLASVTIPNSVTNIGGSAFSGCSSLASVTIPNSITSIGGSTFEGCSSLTSVTIPNSVTSIGGYAFFNCYSLTSVSIPNNVTSIGEYAFYNVPNIEYTGTAEGSPWGARSLNGYVEGWLVYSDESQMQLLACSAIATGKIVIPESVTSIGYQALSNCRNLTSVSIGNKVESIESCAFYACSSLTEIAIPNSVARIGDGAFGDCSALTSIEWNAKNCENFTQTTSPFYYYFDNTCYGDIRTQISSFKFGDEVKHIPAYLCCGMDKLTSIKIPQSVRSVGKSVFDDCSNLTDIFVPCGSFEYYKRLLSNDERVKNKTLAYTVDVTTIGEGSVSGADCIDGDADDTIAELTAIPANPYHRFVRWSDGNTDNPRTIILTQDTMMCAIFEYILTDKCGKDSALTWKMDTTTMTLRIYGNGELTSNYTYDRNMKSLFIGDGITSIGDKAFDGCSSLTSLTVGEGVTSIGSMAFYDCENLSSVVWNAISCSDFYVNYPYIYTPFSYMYKNYDTEFTAPIESFTFGNKVKRIPAGLCYGLDKLTTIVIPEGCDSICNNAFKSCGKITTITLPSTLNYIGENAFTTERIMDVYNYSLTPQDMEGKGFDSWVLELRGVLASARLYVPMQSLELYRNAFFWGYFGNILPIQSTTVETNGVNVSATETSATVVWPQVNNAATYELVIKDQNGNVVCTLVFDSEGKLVSIAFNAPARDNSTDQVQTAGFEFTVTGLDSGTTYDLTITAKDSNDQTLQTTTQTFTTEGLTSVEDVETAIDLNKVIRNGQLFILRGDKTYTVQGQEVR